VSEQDSPGFDVRASDAERDAVVARINQAVGEGRLTLDEFSERLELAYAARTRGDLDPLLRDLPAGGVPAVTSGTVVVSGGDQGNDTRWNISPIGGIRHRGHWRVPRHTVAIGILGGVDVDLSEADLAAPEVMITKVSIIGGVSVRVPPGMRVEVSNFSILGGRDSNLGGPLAPNAPVLHIRSFSIIGGVNVRESRKKRNRDVGG
jgi:Domain of unknown function (DUF1707)/Cell wall-active antibiotics response 4TMS YvqF